MTTTDLHDTQGLRPLERRVLALRQAGESDADIARRFRRGPGFAKQVARLARIQRAGSDGDANLPGLTALERRVLRWRDQGARYEEMAWRFRRSPQHLQRVEGLARYKLRRSGAGG
jgi:DNA-binding CsgD family transcriptional regulator